MLLVLVDEGTRACLGLIRLRPSDRVCRCVGADVLSRQWAGEEALAPTPPPSHTHTLPYCPLLYLPAFKYSIQ